MDNEQVLAWITSFVEGVRRSRVKTLAALVHAALAVQTVAVTLIGREVLGPTKERHGIKRFDRFLGNAGVEVREVQRSIARLLRKRTKQPWLIALDWTSMGNDRFQMLTASVVVRGRAVPLFWMTVAAKDLKKAKTNLVRRGLRHLRTIVPADQPATVLADREFGNSILVKHLRKLNFRFVLRCRGNITVTSAAHTGLLSTLNLGGGRVHVLKNAQLTLKAGTEVTIVATWQKGQKEPWYLIAEIDERATRAVWTYGRRFRIEETFRDGKEMRFGMRLNALQLTTAARYDRIMAVVVLAYLIWLACGERSVRDGTYRNIQTNSTERRTLSIYRLGLHFLRRVGIEPHEIAKLLVLSLASNWG